MKIYHLLLFLISFSAAIVAQDSVPVSQSQEIIYDLDTTKKVTTLDPQKINTYKEDPDFKYIELEATENWWTQFKKWFSQIFERFYKWLFGEGNTATGILGYILISLPYLLVIAVLCLLIWLFMRVNPKDMLFEKQIAPQVVLTEDEDIIQNQDIQQLIQKALQDNNYRLAIRYYYLSVLKVLSDTEHIAWESQKTNTDYIKELTDDSIKKKFKNITRLYDFIWYGNFEVDEQSYKTAEQKFKSLTNSIHT